MNKRKVSPIRALIRAALRDVTPVRLWLLFGLAAFGFTCFCVATVVTVKQHMHALDTIGLDAAPSVIAAHQIKISVAAMDMALADELLSTPGQRAALELVDDFEKERASVCRELVAAAKNITYGSSEQKPIENIQIALGSFEMQAQKARDLHNQGKEDDAMSMYRAGLDVLNGQILTNVDALDKANSDVLEDTYSKEKQASALSRGLVLVLGMVLVCLLLYMNVYISVHFKRRLNMPLILTMFFVSIFLRYLTTALADSSRGLVVAKEDAYNSVLALLDTRANAYLSDDALSRCLLDKSLIAAQSKYFAQNMDRIAAIPPNQDGQALLANASNQLENGQHLSLPGLSGSLVDELANVRFPGEKRAALDSFSTFLAYRDTTAQEMGFINAGRQADALQVGLGYDPHGVNAAFARFDDAIVRTLRINQDALKDSVRVARRALDGLVGGSIVFSVLMVLNTYLGLRPRIQEYQIESYLHRRNLKRQKAEPEKAVRT